VPVPFSFSFPGEYVPRKHEDWNRKIVEPDYSISIQVQAGTPTVYLTQNGLQPNQPYTLTVPFLFAPRHRTADANGVCKFSFVIPFNLAPGTYGLLLFDNAVNIIDYYELIIGAGGGIRLIGRRGPAKQN
jgi:hypothetical protein